MAQGGKVKTKANLPAGAKQKSKQKGPKFNRRKNAPITPKKAKALEAQKLKQTVAKAVNQNIEDEMRKRAYDGKNQKLSNIQEAVAKHHLNKSSTSSSVA